MKKFKNCMCAVGTRLRGQCKLCAVGTHMCSGNQGDCCGCAEPMKLTWLDLEKEPGKVYWEEPGALATVLSYSCILAAGEISGRIFGQVHDMITLSVLDIPSFAMQTTGWKYLRVDRKSSQDLIGNDMKPTVV